MQGRLIFHDNNLKYLILLLCGFLGMCTNLEHQRIDFDKKGISGSCSIGKQHLFFGEEQIFKPYGEPVTSADRGYKLYESIDKITLRKVDGYLFQGWCFFSTDNKGQMQVYSHCPAFERNVLDVKGSLDEIAKMLGRNQWAEFSVYMNYFWSIAYEEAPGKFRFADIRIGVEEGSKAGSIKEKIKVISIRESKNVLELSFSPKINSGK